MHIKSDYYTHVHDLPPQLGGCEPNGDDEQKVSSPRCRGQEFRV